MPLKIFSYPCLRDQDNYIASTASCAITEASNNSHFHSYLFHSLFSQPVLISNIFFFLCYLLRYLRN